MINNKENLNSILLKTAEQLDIPNSRYEQAENRYKSIGEWLNRDSSKVAKFKPEIYSQGSFRLGTVIKPISEDDDYDIDLVCVLDISKSDITQHQLKELIGEEIISYSEAQCMNNAPEEGKRCWTLNYADGAQFHMDVLPSIPNGSSFKILLESKGHKNDYAKYAIAITDNTDSNYETITEHWPCSNPKGYYEWFKTRMKTQFDNEKRRILLDAHYASIEEVPDHKVKTPLQRVIQLLKRHRDIMFNEDSDNKPISIIITTLAAKAYNNETNVIDAYINIISNMEKYIEKKDEVYYISNPVNPLENFADKWVTNHEREENFFKWLTQIKKELEESLSEELLGTINKYKNIYGEKIINEAMKNVNIVNHKNLPLANIIRNLSISHRKKPTWPMLNYKDVTISADWQRNGFRRTSFRSDEYIDKNCNLTFEASTNVSKPYKVYWQITNTGEEAGNARCLRGEFYDGIIEKGGLVRTEESLYKGRHLVECFIVKNGCCVARSGEFIVNII